MNKKIDYALGLDIGITSVGWSIINLNKNRIEDLGVRIFNAAENPKDGSSLALPRRMARGRRRLLRRKAYRVKKVKRLLVKENILSQDELNGLFENKNVISVWECRVKALNEKVSKEEWAKILINFCKRRGFKSNKKSNSEDKEEGIILESIKANEQKLEESGYRTIGELIYNEVNNSNDKYKPLRNKYGSYSRCVSRSMIKDEIYYLFEKQREFNNEYASKEFESKYIEIFDSQRPFSKFEDLEKMVGNCTLEKNEKRAPKQCISAEEFTLYDNMNRLSIINNGDKRKLSKEERKIICDEAFKKKELKYSTLRKILKLKDDDLFSTLNYNLEKADKSKTENAKFVSLSGYYEIKKVISYGISKEYFESIKDSRKLLNDIVYVLTVSKTDEDTKKQLSIRQVPEEIIDCVCNNNISFSKFNNLSIKAIENILPYVKEGYQYNEACEKVGYDFKGMFKGEKSYKLPVIQIDEIVNPVVNRALAQTRKVINAVIEQYGSPVRINIELARELAKNFSDRSKIAKEQEINRANKEKIIEEIKELMNKEPTGSEILKYRLWKEQNGECAYSQRGITIDELFTPGYCEFDHILPFSRSFDDGLNNKVLVLGKENQRKGNRTPCEYLGSNEERWNAFEIWVNNSTLRYKKKNNLLKKKFLRDEQKDWKARNLQDTQYICKYIATFVNNRLKFNEDSEFSRPQKVITVNGRATAYLRAVWGLIKVRENGDKHHALDATVVAVTTQGMVQKISKFNKANELRSFKEIDEFVDVETGEVIDVNEYSDIRKNKLIPRPWQGFSEELKIRLSNDPISELNKYPISTYDKEFIRDTVRPIFVSRVPFRKAKGKLFKETVYSKKAFTQNGYVAKKKLVDLTLKDMDNVYNYECDKILYDAIKEKLIEADGKAKKAFEEEFRKPTKSGKLGPVVKSIKIIAPKMPINDGIDMNEGIVQKEGIVRIDIYEKDNKYYAVPVYRYQIAKGIIPKKAAVASKKEEDWTIMNETYNFKFSIFKNDLIEIRYKNKKGYFGYFDGFDRSTASLTIEEHDNSNRNRGIGIKTNVIVFNKYFVDVLGKYYLSNK